MKRLLIGCGVVVMAGCGGSPLTPVVPPAPVVPSCQANSTASVSFQNRSSSYTYTVSWDGMTVATLAPGTTSSSITTGGNVSHTLRFYYANSSSQACTTGYPIPTICGVHSYYCG